MSLEVEDTIQEDMNQEGNNPLVEVVEDNRNLEADNHQDNDNPYDQADIRVAPYGDDDGAANADTFETFELPLQAQKREPLGCLCYN